MIRGMLFVDGAGAGIGSREEEMRCAMIMVRAGLAKMVVLILEVPLVLARKQEVVSSSWLAASLHHEISL